MKNIVSKIIANRYFLLFILLFAYLQSIYSRIAVRREIDAYIFTPEAALFTLIKVGILFFILSFFLRKWQKSETFRTQEMLKIFGVSLISFVITVQVIAFLIALTSGKMEQNFSLPTFLLSLFSDLLTGIIYGSFLLTYYYFKKSKKQQQNLARYNKALAESKINQLKTQLNPHFLFNNLNVLDQFIEEDKNKASAFLNEFAEIYRYVLQASDKDLIDIQLEIEFAQQYFNLIQHKYEKKYQLCIENKETKGFIVPLSLQLLIENAVQHNVGTAENPIQIQIVVENNIRVSNNLHLKANPKNTSGRALNNLKEQYKLLAEKPLEIHQNENYFSVIIPLIEHPNE